MYNLNDCTLDFLFHIVNDVGKEARSGEHWHGKIKVGTGF